MKTIGLIGGMSWESSLEYYRIINETVKERLGGFHSAECLMYSFDFQVVEKLQHEGNWEGLTELMVQAAQRIKTAGAEFIVCTPELLSIELARQRKEELLHCNVDLNRVSVILNRSVRRGAPPDRIEDLLELPVPLIVPNDYHTILESTMKGELVKGSTKLGKAYLAAAEMITGAQAPSLPPRLATVAGRV